MSDLETGVTIKYGKGYEETWATFRGSVSQIQSQITLYFGLTEADTEGKTLNDVVIYATAIAHGKVNRAAKAGVIETETTPPTQEEAIATVEEKLGGEVIEDTKPDNTALIVALGTAESTNDLKRLWVENKTAFEDADVKAAYKKRGAALKTAA